MYSKSKSNSIVWGIFAVLLIVNYLPTFKWMFWRYEETGSYSSHGYLIPLISGWLIWTQRKNLPAISNSGNIGGVVLVVFSLLIHLVAGLADVSSISGFTIITVLFGFIIIQFGVSGFKKIWFPVGFLFFMIPLPDFIISGLNFKLKFWASDMAAWMLDNTGLPAIREGSFILFEGEKLAIGDVCSGLRSLLALTAMGILYTWIVRKNGIRNILLTLVTILPAAVIGNGLRIFLVCWLVKILGAGAILTPFFMEVDVHLLTGLIIFLGAFGTLYAVNRIAGTGVTSKGVGNS